MAMAGLLIKRSEYERRTGSGGHTQGRVHPDIGRQARKVGPQRSALCGLGDLSRQGLARKPQSAVCLADQRLVRANYSALRRWRQNLATARDAAGRTDPAAGTSEG